jgi:hypothetical protein
MADAEAIAVANRYVNERLLPRGVQTTFLVASAPAAV